MICFLTLCSSDLMFLFFFNDTATTEIYTLSLHDALPIFVELDIDDPSQLAAMCEQLLTNPLIEDYEIQLPRSEEHTSELQSRQYLVCRLLLEKKKKQPKTTRLT